MTGLFAEVLVGDQPADSPAAAPPLVLTHGFSQNTRCWGRFATLLSNRRTVVAVDAPGHGHSGHDTADLWQAGDLVIGASPPGANIHIGYSMGGRIALHAALTHPGAVAGLVLIGATPGIVDTEARAQRRVADNELADRIETEGLEHFLDRWLTNPLFAGLTPQTAARAERLTNRTAGLAASLRHVGTGTQKPLWDRLAELTMPVLLLAGSNDTKFASLADQMRESMISTRAEVVRLPGGHPIHLEAAEPAARVVLDWLAADGLNAS